MNVRKSHDNGSRARRTNFSCYEKAMRWLVEIKKITDSSATLDSCRLPWCADGVLTGRLKSTFYALLVVVLAGRVSRAEQKNVCFSNVFLKRVSLMNF